MIERKIIYGCESEGTAGVPYLTRWILLRTRFGGLYLHYFHRSDGRILHDHPWPFVSLILWRGYYEETPGGKRRKWPGTILFRPASHAHRVELVNEKPAVTLVWAGKRVREWGFHCPDGWMEWRRFFAERGC